MKAVAFREIPAAAWDNVADHSGAAWGFHRHGWVEVEARFAAKANCSFGILDDDEALIGIQPLYRRDLDRGWLERVLDSGYHRHTGLALREDLQAETRKAAVKLAMRRIFEEAGHYDVDRILLNVQNLAPHVLAGRTAEVPFWVQDYGFELGLHLTAVGDLAVPGLSNVLADQIVPLNAPVDELFRGLDSACQRAIRKAEKSGFTFAPAPTNPVPAYYELATISAQRTGEALLPQAYYQTIWDQFAPPNKAAILFLHQGDRLAAALFLLMDKEAVSFLAGVSHHDFLHLRVNDYLHWQGMCWAKAQGRRYYRFGPVFPELPGEWPVSQVSRFKGKFGGQSYTVIQGNYFRKPQRYLADTVRAADQACRMRIQQVHAQRRAEVKLDPARDLVMALRRYGYLGIDARARDKDLAEKHHLWWPTSAVSLKDAAATVQAVFQPQAEELAALGVQCHAESGKEMLHQNRGRKWWAKKQPIYQALLPHVSFSGPDIEPLWQNVSGRAVLAWWHFQGRKILLVGLNFAEELIRYTQGDPTQTESTQDRARFQFTFERANFLFDTNLVAGATNVPWADRLGYTLVRLLARHTGLPLAEPLPGGAKGLILLTGDDDQAALAAYQQQMDLLGDFPITYFLLPFTKHTAQTLAALPPSVEFGLHVDALEQPDQYETICVTQAAAVRELCGGPVRAIRNHGFLNRGYLGHLRAWEECGLTLDVNYAGLDGTVLTGSLLPFRVRRPDGAWSSHLGLVTAFGDGMRYISKLSEDQANLRIEALAAQIEASDPGVLCFNMHPENIGDTRKMHQCIMKLGRRPGWRALGVETYLQWLEQWQALTLRLQGQEVLLQSSHPMHDLVLQVPLGAAWQRVAMPAGAGLQTIPGLQRAG